jgi:hypothetical protein
MRELLNFSGFGAQKIVFQRKDREDRKGKNRVFARLLARRCELHVWAHSVLSFANGEF